VRVRNEGPTRTQKRKKEEEMKREATTTIREFASWMVEKRSSFWQDGEGWSSGRNGGTDVLHECRSAGRKLVQKNHQSGETAGNRQRRLLRRKKIGDFKLVRTVRLTGKRRDG
jgi:hypothetical protein